MKKLGIFISLIASLATIPAAALEGTLINSDFESAALGGEVKNYQIYLPPGYESSGAFYPVVYFLHGAGSLYFHRYAMVVAVDNLISAGLIEPIILVKPCGRPSAPQMGRWLDFPNNSYFPLYLDSELMGAYESYPVVDLVSHIDANHRTLADRDHRSVCGHSAGSQGAIRYALLHPDVFGGVASLGSFLDWLSFDGACAAAAQEQGFRPVEEFEPTFSNWAGTMLSTAGHYLPNPNNPPWYVDYPCLQNGQRIAALWSLVDAQTARAVAEGLAVPELDLHIGIFAAWEDQPAVDSAQRFAAVLDEQWAAHTLRIYHSDRPDPHDDIRPEMFITFLHPMRASAMANPTHLYASLPLDAFSVQLRLSQDLPLDEVASGSVVISAINGSELSEPVESTVEIQGDTLEADFDWSEVMDALETAGVDDGAPVRLTIRGEMTDGRFFAGTDTVHCDTEHMAKDSISME